MKWYKFIAESEIGKLHPRTKHIYKEDFILLPNGTKTVNEYVHEEEFKKDWEEVTEEYIIENDLISFTHPKLLKFPNIEPVHINPHRDEYENAMRRASFSESQLRHKEVTEVQKEALEIMKVQISEQSFLDVTAQLWLSHREIYAVSIMNRAEDNKKRHFSSLARQAYDFAEALLEERKRRYTTTTKPEQK